MPVWYHHHPNPSSCLLGEKSGLHIVLEVKNNLEEAELVSKAINVGISVYPFSLYYQGTIKSLAPRILLGFGGLSETEINTGIRLLKEAWKLQ